MWIVTVNAPGYLPDEQPSECNTWEEALIELSEAIRLTCTSLDPDGMHTQGDECLCREAVPNEPYSIQIIGLTHSVAFEEDAG